MVYFLILCCAIFAPFAQSSQMQKYMTKDEIKNFFGTDEVPDHAIAKIYHKIDKRGVNELMLKTTINDIETEYYLRPIDGFLAGSKTKVWTAKTYGGKLDYTLEKNAMKDALANFYQDEKTMSSISHSKDEDGNSLFAGTFDFDKEVRPIPKHIRYRRDLLRKNVSSLENTDESYTKTIDHVIFRKAPSQNSNSTIKLNSAYNHVEKYMSRNKRAFQESDLKAPLVVYPEILIYVDDTIFDGFDQNVGKAVQYLLTFWNVVDMKYRFLKNPKVFLNIAGIILAKDELPFLKTEIFNDKKMVNKYCINDFGKFLNNEKKFKLQKDYDLAIVMTGKDMYSKLFKDNAVIGIATVGGACRSFNEDNFYATGMIEDHNNYSGISTASHELAHLFGVNHDGDAPIKYVGGPGSQNCSWDDGHIMSYENKNINKMYFSTCSQQSMTYFFNRKVAECLRNNPTKKDLGKLMPKVLPGKYLSLDQQCNNAGFQKAKYYNSSVCLNLICESKSNETIGSTIIIHTTSLNIRSAVEGSSCGVNMICLAGKCVKDVTKTASNLPITYTDGPISTKGPFSIKSQRPMTTEGPSILSTTPYSPTYKYWSIHSSTSSPINKDWSSFSTYYKNDHTNDVNSFFFNSFDDFKKKKQEILDDIKRRHFNFK